MNFHFKFDFLPNFGGSKSKGNSSQAFWTALTAFSTFWKISSARPDVWLNLQPEVEPQLVKRISDTDSFFERLEAMIGWSY